MSEEIGFYKGKIFILLYYLLISNDLSLRKVPPASTARRQAQVLFTALKRADCLSVASFCPLAGGNTGVVGKTQP